MFQSSSESRILTCKKKTNLTGIFPVTFQKSSNIYGICLIHSITMTPPVVPSHLPMSSLHRPCHLERLLLSSHGNALQAPLPNHKVHQTSSTKLWTPGFQEHVFMLGILSFKRSIYIFFSLNQRIQVSLIQNPCFNYVLTAVSLKQSIHIHPTIPLFRVRIRPRIHQHRLWRIGKIRLLRCRGRFARAAVSVGGGEQLKTLDLQQLLEPGSIQSIFKSNLGKQGEKIMVLY